MRRSREAQWRPRAAGVQAERLSEDGRERAAGPRDASACAGGDLEGQRTDDHVKDPFYNEAHAGEPLDRAETVHRFIVHRIA